MAGDKRDPSFLGGPIFYPLLEAVALVALVLLWFIFGRK